jgi:predicted MFS family arabinose efflux permease
MHEPKPQTASPADSLGVSEGRLLFLVSAVQFVNILDFMMVMPLGPDFAKDLAIPVTALGLIGGSYTAAAAASGVVCSRFLDRFDRRSALAAMMLGLVIATALGGLAQDLTMLIAARVLAGIFGGPATSLSLSIIADVIPAERRGRALGTVMGAFSAATVLGLPISLELARVGSWRTPFFAVAAMGLVVAASALLMMPKLTLHLAELRTTVERPLWVFVQEPAVFVALVATATVMTAAFSVIPNISTYIQHNMHYPRDNLSVLYLAGGGVSFITMRLIGRYVDSLGAPRVSAIGTVLFVGILFVSFVIEWRAVPVIALFVVFMSAMAIRNVSMSALTSRVPAPFERARFMSLQSAVQHLASSLGAFVSSLILTERPDHSLRGMPTIASVAIGLALLLPVLLAQTERLVRARDGGAPAAAARASAGART